MFLHTSAINPITNLLIVRNDNMHGQKECSRFSLNSQGRNFGEVSTILYITSKRYTYNIVALTGDSFTLQDMGMYKLPTHRVILFLENV